MTEAEWLACTDPGPMLAFLSAKGSRRRYCLFCVACCRRVVDLARSEVSTKAVEVAEHYADGQASGEELRSAADGAQDEVWLDDICVYMAVDTTSDEQGDVYKPASTSAAENCARYAAYCAAAGIELPEHAYDVSTHAARNAARAMGYAHGPNNGAEWEEARLREWATQSNLLRDIFGNPFHPLPMLGPAWFAWNDGAVRRLAQAAYDDRQLPAGTLDPSRLAVLADALEDAGCFDRAILDHLRGPGVHVRGCWCLDLLLEKN
jgi:hypothetical protein